MSNVSERFDYISDLGHPSAHAFVARMRERSSGREYAVKMARPGESVRRRFDREVAAMRSASGTHVMPVVDVDGDGEWYSMPVAQRELSIEPGRVGESGLIGLAFDVARAVSAGLRDFHSSGQVHRDLKPQNILWLEDEGGARWVVSDFGIARNRPGETTAPLTMAGNLVGTDGWAAPEQYVDAHAASVRSDVFSLGAISGWILTGIPPRFASVDLPEGVLRAPISRATRRAPELRHANLDLLVEDMEKAFDLNGGGPLTSQLDAVMTSPIDIGALSDFAVAHRDDGLLLLPKLPELGRVDLQRWAKQDPDGLHSVALSFADMLGLGGDRARLQWEELRPPLNFLLNAIGALLCTGHRPLGEQLAITYFESLEACDQWECSQACARWLKGLAENDASAMIAAVDASGSREYIRGYLESDWATSKSTALRRWLK